jgi:hypothetical protein
MPFNLPERETLGCTAEYPLQDTTMEGYLRKTVCSPLADDL